MAATICYLGDGPLRGAAGYLAGVMQHEGLTFDHVLSDRPPPGDFSKTEYHLYVVSDYPAARFGAAAMTHVVERVRRGAGLLMLGGWESFFGRLGEYHDSPLAEVLPVVMMQSDDRRNCAQPCLIEKIAGHPILAGLPWDRPPGIGGFNSFSAKKGSETILRCAPFAVRHEDDQFHFTRGATSPLLVVGRHGEGRTAALAVDAAPHWVGGLVDWGDGRVTQQVDGEEFEFGNWYAWFFGNLVRWTGGME
jgi:hypothetical protein